MGAKEVAFYFTASLKRVRRSIKLVQRFLALHNLTHKVTNIVKLITSFLQLPIVRMLRIGPGTH